MCVLHSSGSGKTSTALALGVHRMMIYLECPIRDHAQAESIQGYSLLADRWRISVALNTAAAVTEDYLREVATRLLVLDWLLANYATVVDENHRRKFPDTLLPLHWMMFQVFAGHPIFVAVFQTLQRMHMSALELQKVYSRIEKQLGYKVLMVVDELQRLTECILLEPGQPSSSHTWARQVVSTQCALDAPALWIGTRFGLNDAKFILSVWVKLAKASLVMKPTCWAPSIPCLRRKCSHSCAPY